MQLPSTYWPTAPALRRFSPYTVPRLTTIRQNTTVLAERAADILLRCIEENAPARHETVPFELVKGESI